MRILFICEGNMMRSQMAEALYNVLTKSEDAKSAGAVAETKDHISPRAVEAMAEIDYDVTTLAPKQLTEQMVNATQKVVYFPSDYMPAYVKNNPKAELWDVIDPHYHRDQGMDLVRHVRDEIRQKVIQLIGEDSR